MEKSLIYDFLFPPVYASNLIGCSFCGIWGDCRFWGNRGQVAKFTPWVFLYALGRTIRSTRPHGSQATPGFQGGFALGSSQHFSHPYPQCG